MFAPSPPSEPTLFDVWVAFYALHRGDTPEVFTAFRVDLRRIGIDYSPTTFPPRAG